MSIIPGSKIGALCLGMTEAEVRLASMGEWRIVQRNGCYILKKPDLWVFFSDESKQVEQIMATGSCKAALDAGIGIDSTLGELRAKYGVSREMTMKTL